MNQHNNELVIHIIFLPFSPYTQLKHLISMLLLSTFLFMHEKVRFNLIGNYSTPQVMKVDATIIPPFHTCYRTTKDMLDSFKAPVHLGLYFFSPVPRSCICKLFAKMIQGNAHFKIFPQKLSTPCHFQSWSPDSNNQLRTN